MVWDVHDVIVRKQTDMFRLRFRGNQTRGTVTQSALPLGFIQRN